ncbi:SH3 domain-containing C40 family peptidase [Halodesulfovibrio marinisediminis]|uniref:Cell wall-associated hydrolase, NlpC family n=1 Tax=Halodesulfovibrio marinisediminis DSM 17456 TaxID=1121457 RepID=A0A1N6IUT4_9BACT|nr:SH3 domain-containing C40 family peptidase [Halodesulfovibrio marinisediminis]SIO35705.1 Cell wall-associated hydrolase, NlpC family [Halodesulfovibrio marinisediminis DSM 17456]
MVELVRNSQRWYGAVKTAGSLVVLMTVCMSVAACSTAGRYPVWEYNQQHVVADVNTLSQDPTDYLTHRAHTAVMTPEEQTVQFAALKVYHFGPWRQTKASLSKKDAFWGVTAYPYTRGYAENLLPWTHTAMSRLVAEQSMETYPSMAKHAITVRSASLRVMPTVKPYFLNPALPGEGFPFDYFQNSSVHAGTPLFISHVSKSGKWLFAETAFASGWVLASDVAYVTPEQEEEFMSGALQAIIRDDVPLKTLEGEYISTGYVGAIFPKAPSVEVPAPPPLQAMAVADAGARQAAAKKNLLKAMTGSKNDGVGYKATAAAPPRIKKLKPPVYITVPARNSLGQAEFYNVPVWSEQVVEIPATLTPGAMAEVAKHVIGQRYGWGGLYLDRDCSSTVRDLFMAFGVWLPRNSSQQAAKGKEIIELKGLTASEKQDVIVKQGIPFFSLIGMRGHIGLYLGYEPVTKMPLMLHDLWGVRTYNADRESRAIIGRIAITTLRPGEERKDVKKDYFYSRILKLQVKPGTWEIK